MPDRFSLISRKNEVRRQLERLQRQLDHEQTKAPPINQRRLQQLAAQIEQLMAEESTLRVAIDQNK